MKSPVLVGVLVLPHRGSIAIARDHATSSAKEAIPATAVPQKASRKGQAAARLSGSEGSAIAGSSGAGAAAA